MALLRGLYFLLNSGSFSKSSGFQRATRVGFIIESLIIEPYPFNMRVQPHFAEGEQSPREEK